MRRVARVAVLLLPLGAAAAVAAPQRPAVTPEPDVPETAGKILRAMRVVGAGPVVDGRLGDDVWTTADAIEDFVQNEPDNMAAATERTVVQIAYDDRYVYVAARCYTDRGAPTTGLGRRDDVLPTDRFLVGFDPRHDLMLRWEYLRGSTLFVVWNRSAVNGDVSQVAMMKVSYWLGR